MKLRNAIVMMMAAMGLRQAASAFANSRSVAHKSLRPKGKLHTNQRQRRKDRRRRHAAGDKKAFV